VLAPHKQKRRVVVTGMGAVTSLGLQVTEIWDAVLAGRSGVGWLESFDARGLPVRIASEVDLTKLPEPAPEVAQLLSRSGRFGLTALSSAWRDAGLDSGAELDRSRLAVCVGASSLPTLEHYLEFAACQQFDAQSFLELMSKRPGLLAQRNIPFIGTLLAHAIAAGGPCITVQTACSSANQALGEAFHLISSGRADVALSGGADSMLSLFCVVGFTLLGALARCDEPTKASRPFDATRNGMVLGEGAGLVVLEDLEHALRRNATIHAELIGYGASSDGHRLTDVHPDGIGATACMQRALKCAEIAPTEVDYINAHGTSTPQNDRVETLAIKRVFGDYARRLPVSSTKSQLGHLVCAAGGIEFILCVMALKNGILPATINLERRDPECDLDYVPNQPRLKPIRVALSNSFGFGGQNGTVVLKRWDGDPAPGEV
jgi:3-oxoacyl-[acyl-carrier-protein] synthase II